jgi:hypothetical protein
MQVPIQAGVAVWIAMGNKNTISIPFERVAKCQSRVPSPSLVQSRNSLRVPLVRHIHSASVPPHSFLRSLFSRKEARLHPLIVQTLCLGQIDDIDVDSQIYVEGDSSYL